MKQGILSLPALSLVFLFQWSAGETVFAQSALDETGEITILQEKTRQGYPYLSGGVGTDEREAMQRLAKSFNLRLSFADKRGPYLSDVILVIEGPGGAEIVNTKTRGPWFFIQLPEGTYTIKATFKGKTQEMKALRVEKGKTWSRTLLWDADAETVVR